MVATRRTACIEPELDMTDLGNTLRKKPVRRATVKKTGSQPEPKPRATRSRKVTTAAAISPEPEIDVAEEPCAEEIQPALQAKPVRKPGRPKKDVSMRHIEDPALPKPTKPTRSTAAFRAKKIKVLPEKQAEVPALSEMKPARRTRATTTKAQTLSPKKITQVAKLQTRNVKTVNQKSAALKAASRARIATRKRTVSDENTDIPDLVPNDQTEDEEVDLVETSSTAVKCTSPVKQSAASDTAVDSEASMSSRATTPSHSPAPSFDQMIDEDEYAQRGAKALVSDSSDDEQGDEDVSNDSGDELCGPKTPMKRSRIGAEARYLASVQRTIRRAEASTPMESPRTFANRMMKRGTPQTQKPYSKPSVPALAVKPMTVAHGSHKTFVFKDLHSAPAVEVDGQEASIHEGGESSVSEQNESVCPVMDALEEDAEVPAQVHEGSDTEVDEDEHVSIEDADSVQSDAPIEREIDPDEIVIINDEGSDTSLPSPAKHAESFESEETVLITKDEDDSLLEVEHDLHEVDEVESHVPVSAASSTPETLVWENIRQDVTIPINFDAHMTCAHDVCQDTTQNNAIAIKFDEHMVGARTLPQSEAFERLSIVADFAPLPAEDVGMDAVAGAEQDEVLETTTLQGNSLDAQRTETAPGRESLDATVDLNDFIDMAALAEPTQAIEIPATPAEMDDQVPSPAAEKDMEITGGMQSVESSSQEALDREGQPVETQDQKDEDAEPDTADSEEEAIVDDEVPHYALPTLAFDARRKSLPAFDMRTPVKAGSRPNTSDGASMPRIANSFAQSWWNRSRANSTVATPSGSPARAQMSTPKTVVSAKNIEMSEPDAIACSPVTAHATPKERYPRREPRQDYQEHANTAAPPARFRTPVRTPIKRRATVQKQAQNAVTPRAITLRPRNTSRVQKDVTNPISSTVATPTAAGERFPRLGSRPHYQEHAQTVAGPTRFHTPAKSSVTRPVTAQKAMASAATPNASSWKPKADAVEPDTPSVASSLPSMAGTPTPAVETPAERFPRLPPQQDYNELAKTVTGPVRFQTPSQTPVKRPSTVQKQGSLRKVAFKNSTPKASRTPVKTPLKPPATTPSQAPMTPHPAAPLKSVVAVVEVFTLEGASASAPFVALLHRLGAKTTKVWSERVTHVIFKDGSPTTLQRVRLHNKEVEEKGMGSTIHCVNSRWVNDCEADGKRVAEADEAYAVDVAEVPRGGRRRRKSMEPSTLVNLAGNIVRDRKNSLSRSSLGRSPLKFDSPAKKPEVAVEVTPKMGMEDKENEPSSPATPAYLAAPDKLVQQTAPIHRVRKLRITAPDRAKNRRLTYFPSHA